MNKWELAEKACRNYLMKSRTEHYLFLKRRSLVDDAIQEMVIEIIESGKDPDDAAAKFSYYRMLRRLKYGNYIPVGETVAEMEALETSLHQSMRYADDSYNIVGTPEGRLAELRDSYGLPTHLYKSAVDMMRGKKIHERQVYRVRAALREANQRREDAISTGK